MSDTYRVVRITIRINEDQHRARLGQTGQLVATVRSIYDPSYDGLRLRFADGCTLMFERSEVESVSGKRRTKAHNAVQAHDAP